MSESTWTAYPVTNIHIAPAADANLLATRVLRDLHGAVHHFEQPCRIVFPDREAAFGDIGNAFVLRAAFGPPPAPLGRSAVTTTALAHSAAVPSVVRSRSPSLSSSWPPTTPTRAPLRLEPRRHSEPCGSAQQRRLSRCVLLLGVAACLGMRARPGGGVTRHLLGRSVRAINTCVV